ncbi:MAG: glycoside hydrolase family 57 protein [Methanothrix sp.]
MTDISICFEVHQPFRLKKDFFWSGSIFRRSGPHYDFYFDDKENRSIFERVSKKCYLPANRIMLDLIKRFSDADRPFKVAYSLSGVFVEQCRRYRPDVLDTFIELVDTGNVELLDQTYYHSLTSLFDREEFREQVRMHRELMWDIFGVRPAVFENTELIYNDEIAAMAEQMGYRGIFAEGVIADPNHVYRPEGCERISLLLRNYQLTDDIGFRFSSRSWEEFPLTADKYAAWLAATPGRCINLFMDYETFGEHHWPETGIFEFLRYLPGEILKWKNLRFSTPSEIVEIVEPSRTVSVRSARSWADLERDTSCWLGNALQWACYTYLQQLQGPSREAGEEMLRIWRLLGLSDHLYYIFTHGGGPGEVHSYFSPYGNPYDAAVTYFSVLSDLHRRLSGILDMADHPFVLSTKDGTKIGTAWSSQGMVSLLSRADADALEHHASLESFATWASQSLGDESLARALRRASKLKGEDLRGALLDAFKRRIKRAAKNRDAVE